MNRYPLSFLKTTYRWSDGLNITVIALLYAILAKIALSFFSVNGVVSVVWPSSGLALAALLLGGKHYWLGVFIGAFAGNVLVGNSVDLSFIIACGNTLEALMGLFLLSRIDDFDSGLNQPRDYLYLVLAGASSAGVSALIGNSALLAYHLVTQDGVFSNFFDWWLGDALGIILVTPFILVWRQLPTDWLTPQRRLETIACFGLAFLAGQVIFLNVLDILVGRARGYWMFLFIAWTAMRYGRRGVSLIISMIMIQGLLGFIQHRGFFGAGMAQVSLFNFTCYILILTTVGISLALIIKKRQHTEQALRLSEQALRLSEQHLLTAQRIAHLGSFEWNVNHDKLFLSKEIYRMLGFPFEEQAFNRYAAFFDRVYFDDQQTVMDAVNNAIRLRQPYGVDFRIYIASGEQRFIHVQAEVVTNAHGELLMTGTAQDVTERKRAEESLQLAALVYENSSEAMMITDEDDIIMATNPAFSLLTGYTEAEVLGKNPSIRKSGYQDDIFYQNMYVMLELTGQWQGEIWNRHKSGETCAEWLSINTVYHQNGSVYRRVSLFYDITEKKNNEALIWNQANFDRLTDLPNRHLFYDRLEQLLKKAHQYQRSVALLFLDLDHFKAINNSFGHSVGDALLKEVALRLTNCVGETDIVARFGGDEFAIVLEKQPHVSHTETVAQCVLNELIKPFFIDDKTLYISTSIGITVYPDDADNAEMLLKNADQAMYAAKAQGRNRYNYFTPAMEHIAQTRMQLTTDLHSALSKEQLLVYYQPIVTLATGAIHKAEALIRWQHPERGVINPSDFIPIAEESGMIIDIGEWVFRQVTQQVAHWRDNYDLDFQISINKSPVQFHNRDTFCQSWPEQLKTLGLSGQSIVVEITEGMLLEANEVIYDKLMDFRKANIEVSLDDFGTGYSSLSYLKKFHIDYLKIDQSFVCNLKAESDDMALCNAIIVMAHALGIKVIAEGIETAEQCNLLTNAGCDYGQGYLFSKAVPAAEFEHLFDVAITANTPSV
jgi:diguanylate cyclase (GGDEF)-like protein/PAS domain S-box-containing protein